MAAQAIGVGLDLKLTETMLGQNRTPAFLKVSDTVILKHESHLICCHFHR